MKPRHVATCTVCGAPFEAKRRDARLCSDRCRQRASRAKVVTLIVPFGGRSAHLKLPPDIARWLRDQLIEAVGRR